MCRFSIRIFLILFLPYCVHATKELTVLTGFFAGQWAPHGFDELEKEIRSRKILKSKYEKINVIDICLGTGSKEEELQNGWKVIETLKNSLIKDSEVQDIVKQYDSEKPEFAMAFSSVSAAIARFTLQKYAEELPFKVKHLIAISSPQTGIDSVPPSGKYDNPVEKSCSDVQASTTTKIIKTYTKFLPVPSWLFSGISYLSQYVDQEKIAWQTLYQPSVQENLISLWRDTNHLESYQSCGGKNTPPFLPFFNNELLPTDMEKYKIDLNELKKNIALTDYFDFIGSDNDKFMPLSTSLCREKISHEGKKTIYLKQKKFLNRIGIGPKKAKFHTVENAGHQCHTNKGIIMATADCLEDRCG